MRDQAQTHLERLIVEKDKNATLGASMGMFRRPGFRWAKEHLGPIVRASFQQDRSNPTLHQAKWRTEILARYYRELRSDLHWSEERILEHLPYILRCELDGKRWEPPSVEDAWAPSVLAAQLERTT